MPSSLERVLQSALALPEVERAELVDALITSLPPEEQVVFDDALLAEIERRCDELDAGGANTTPWAEVKARVHGRLRRHA